MYSVNMKVVGQRIKTLMLNAGLNQTEMARAVETTQPHISNIVNGNIDMHISLLARIAGVLGTTPSDLLK